MRPLRGHNSIILCNSDINLDFTCHLVLDGLANGLPSWALRLVHPFSATPLQGAFTSLFAATSEEVAAAREKYKGAFLVPYGKLLKLTKEATDPVLAKTLWETSEGVVRDALQRREE